MEFVSNPIAYRTYVRYDSYILYVKDMGGEAE